MNTFLKGEFLSGVWVFFFVCFLLTALLNLKLENLIIPSFMHFFSIGSGTVNFAYVANVTSEEGGSCFKTLGAVRLKDLELLES